MPALSLGQNSPGANAAHAGQAALRREQFIERILRHQRQERSARLNTLTSTASKIVFHCSRGMSEARLVSIYGAEAVRFALGEEASVGVEVAD